MINGRGKGGSSDRFPLVGLQNHWGCWLQTWNQKMIASWQEDDDKPRQCVEKQRRYFADKGLKSIKAMVFPVVMCGCESWTIKKAEHRRIDAFKLWCWKRLLRVPWTARRSNQSILKEINPKYSLEVLILNLQYFGHWCEELTHWKRSWFWERLRAGEGDDTGQDDWMASLTQWMWVWANPGR